MLGIPTAIDRVIQQAIVQVFTPVCEPYFSEYSYGFRPNRNCEMTVNQLLHKIDEGYQWIVDDGDTESLIRKYLQAGVMITNKYEPMDIGTP